MEHMERPEPTVLPDSALVPDESLVRPAPTAFTHELAADQSFHYASSDQTSRPDGVLPAGTKVVLVDESGDVCQVVDGRGLRVTTSRAGLRRLS